MSVRPRSRGVPGGSVRARPCLQDMLSGLVPTDPCTHATRRFEASVVPKVVREISEFDPAREGVICESLDVVGVRNRPVVGQEQNRADDVLAESEFIQFGDIDSRVFEDVMQQSNDLLVALLQGLHHSDRMTYVALTLGRGIYLAAMSGCRKFEGDGKLGSVCGHTDIFASALAAGQQDLDARKCRAEHGGIPSGHAASGARLQAIEIDLASAGRPTRARLVGRKEVRLAMSEIVLRVRLIGGDHVDVTYEEAGAVDSDTVIEHAIAALAEDAGVLRTRHGDRLVVLYGRGVAGLEVAPRGAVV
jgi:hypothetical protein